MFFLFKKSGVGSQGISEVWKGRVSAPGLRWAAYQSAVTSVRSSFHHCGTRTESSFDRGERPQGPRSDRQTAGGSITQTSLPGFYFIASPVPEATAP